MAAFIDMVGLGIACPVLPTLVGSNTPNPAKQDAWYRALAVSYGLMQFFCVPLLAWRHFTRAPASAAAPP